MITEKRIQELLAGKPGEVAEQLILEELGTNNVRSGGKVAVVSDPAYEYDGQVGTVRGPVPHKPSGTVKVEFANGTQVDLCVNQLIPV